MSKLLITLLFLITTIFQVSAQEIELNGQVKIVNGSEGSGKILVSDSVGVATWKNPETTPFPSNYFFMSETNLCDDNRDWIQYPSLMTDTTQVIVGGIDLSLTNNFVAWAKIENVRDDRMSIFTNGGIDALNFLVMQEGIDTIDGKMIQAGKATVSQAGTITFDQAFSSPPIVFLMLDQTSTGTPTTIVNVANNPGVSTTSFNVVKNWAGIDDVFWVAMEPGTYTTDKWKWYAERVPITSTNPTYNFPTDFFSRAPDGFSSLEGSQSSASLKETTRTSATFNTSIFVSSHLHLLFWEEI